MAIVDHLNKWRSLARLRRQTRRSPSPTTFGELAEKLIGLGETDEAVKAAEAGLDLYPDSERLVHVRLYAKKGRLTARLRNLREDLQRRPNPLTYSQLAEVYRELGSHDQALVMAAECAERFPLNEAPYLIQGEIRLERFRRDLIAKDGIIAENALKKVARLNPQNVSAHLHLAEIYWLVGLAEESRRHLRSVLAIMPTALDVREFLREMDGAPDVLGDGGAGADEGDEDGGSFNDLVERVERNGEFANDAQRFPNPAARAAARRNGRFDAEKMREEMSGFVEHAGIRNAALLDKDGVAIADCAGRDSLPREQFAQLAAGIRDTADDASRRMDTGALVRAEIEGPGGNVTVCRVRGMTLAVLYGISLRRERVAEILEDFVAKNLASAPEVLLA